MAIVDAGYAAIIKEILDLLKVRHQRRAVSKAGRLKFWDDGMLRELKAIAAGGPDIDKIRTLREKFEESEASVNRAIRDLLRIRNKLGPGRLASQLDVVINSGNYGKGVIRHDIRQLLVTRRKDDRRQKADEICQKIEILNGELGRLDRMVND